MPSRRKNGTRHDRNEDSLFPQLLINEGGTLRTLGLKGPRSQGLGEIDRE